MKFQHGDNLDVDLSIALKHEFLRCEDAFYDFVETGEQLRRKGPIQGRWKAKNKNDVKRWLAFKRYNAYSRFVHHLYEFQIGAMKREASDTGQIQAFDADIWIQKNAQRVLGGRRSAILRGTAPKWENDISHYPEFVPMDFSKEFRKVRNVTLAHVSHERSSVSLSEFFTQYHAFVMMTFDNCVGFWGCRETNAFPELDGITDFCLIDKSRNDSQAARDAPRTTERQSQILGSIWNFF